MSSSLAPSGSSTAHSTPHPQILLILIGLPGSGKSVLILGQVSKGRPWVRASQDDAPKRRRQECEAVVRDALAERSNVVVDRVDFDPIQRSHFIRLAQTSYPRPLVYALTLHVSLPTLNSRLTARTSHPTLTTPELALSVLKQMYAVFDPPKPGRIEGLDRILELQEGDQPKGGVWTTESVERLIRDIGTWGHAEAGPAGGPSVLPTTIPSGVYLSHLRHTSQPDSTATSS